MSAFRLLKCQNQIHLSKICVGKIPSRQFGSSTGEKPNLIIFYGSIRENRSLDRVSKYLQGVLGKEFDLTIFDPLKMKFEMLKTPLHFYPDPKLAPGWLKETNEKIVKADGFVLLTTEYNSLPPPALLNMIDHFPPSSYANKPTALVTYAMGMYGGARAGITLRTTMSDFGMTSISTSVHIPLVNQNFTEDRKCKNELTVKMMNHMAKELFWYADGLKKLKKANSPPKLQL